MKKFTLILYAFLLFSLNNSQAQFVTLPDSNFVNWLNANGYAACLNGNQLDTTCNKVVTDTLVNCNSANITDIKGIEFFDSLKHLLCYSNNISILPPLPSSLLSIQCSDNLLDKIDYLPSSLFYLYCAYNQLDSLPSLPAGLINLYCGNNPISSLPVLPAMLEQLSCKSNQLDSLPNLPLGLTLLDCQENNLSALGALPSSLIWLLCNNNMLSTLPVLPPSLTELQCNSNAMTVLPALPVTLQHLNCMNNLLTSLPTIPSGLMNLYTRSNQLTSLPALPDSMYNLLIDSNPGILCLPPIAKIMNLFFWQNTGIVCLPNVISLGPNATALPSIAGIPVCDLINPNNCAVNWNIKGTLYTDTNSNCLNDTGEVLLSNMKVNLYQGGVLQQQTFTSSMGEYSFKTGNNTFTYAPDIVGYPFTINCPLSQFYSSTVTNATPYFDNKDFSVSCNSGFDIGVESILRETGIFRPGGYPWVDVLAGDLSSRYNMHCASGTGGSVQVIINGPAEYSSPQPGALVPIVNGDTLYYSIADFGQMDFMNDLSFIVKTDTNALVGSQVCINVSLIPTVGDINPLNNFYTHCFDVVNSFDPNEKEVSPSGATDTSTHWFVYTVHFQNTGNAPAININVVDTLNTNIDEESFQLLAYSFEPIVQVSGKIAGF